MAMLVAMLEDMLRQLEFERSDLERRLAIAYSRIESTKGTLAYARRMVLVDPDYDTDSVEPIDLGPEHSVERNLVEIARRNEGWFATKAAVDTLVKARVFETKAQAQDNVYSTLNRSQRFRKVTSGIYELCTEALRASIRE